MDTFLKLTLNDCEYLGENEHVMILPHFKMKRISLISGDFGPFDPQIPAPVPLWLAIALRKQGKCRIQIPHFIQRDELKALCKRERNSPPDELQHIHERYREMSLLLLHSAAEDVDGADEVRRTVEDTETIRQLKLNASLNEVVTAMKRENASRHIEFTNIGTIELHSLRPFLSEGLTRFDRLNTAYEEVMKSNSAGTMGYYDYASPSAAATTTSDYSGNAQTSSFSSSSTTMTATTTVNELAASTADDGPLRKLRKRR